MQQNIQSAHQGLSFLMNLGSKTAQARPAQINPARVEPAEPKQPDAAEFERSFQSERQTLKGANKSQQSARVTPPEKNSRPEEASSGAAPLDSASTHDHASDALASENAIPTADSHQKVSENEPKLTPAPQTADLSVAVELPEALVAPIVSVSTTEYQPLAPVMPSLALVAEPVLPAVELSPDVLNVEQAVTPAGSPFRIMTNGPQLLSPTIPSPAAIDSALLAETNGVGIKASLSLQGQPLIQAMAPAVVQLASDPAVPPSELLKPDTVLSETLQPLKPAVQQEGFAKFAASFFAGAIQQEQRLKESLAAGLELRPAAAAKNSSVEGGGSAVGSAGSTAQTAGSLNASSTYRSSLTVPFNQPHWGQGMGEKVLWMVSQKLSFAEIQLDPPELGPLQVKISVQNDQVSVSFTSQHAPVRDALDNQVLRLREVLESQGFNLVDVDVSDHPQSDRDSSEQSAKASGLPESDQTDAALIGSASISPYLVDHFV